MSPAQVSKAARKLKKLRESAAPEITIREMAEELEIPHNTYVYYEDAYKKDLLPVDLITKVAPVLARRGVKTEDVLALAGIGPQTGKNQQGNIVDLGGQSFTAIGRFDAAFSMGPGSLIADEPEPLGYWLVETQWLRGLSHAATPELAIVRCSGDSMERTLLDGDWVLVDRTQRRLSREGLYAIRVGDDAWVKRISLNIKTKQIRVLSDNPTTPAQPDVDEEDLSIIGRVIALVARKIA